MLAKRAAEHSIPWHLIVGLAEVMLLPAACVAVLVVLTAAIREADWASRAFLAVGGIAMAGAAWSRSFRAASASRRWRQSRFLAAPVAQSTSRVLSLAADVLFAASLFSIGLVLGGYNLLGHLVAQVVADRAALGCTLAWPWLLLSSFVAEAWDTAAQAGWSRRLRLRAAWTTGQAIFFALGLTAIFLLPSFGDGALASGMACCGVALCIAGLLCLGRAERVGLLGES